MLALEPYQRRWLVMFGATLGILVSVAAWLSLRLPSFREPAFNFYTMKRDEIFNVYELTRRQEGSVKLGFAEAYPAPEIGLYGNHIVAFFGADAFGRPEDAEYFFNYFYANLALPEIHRYLLHVEKKGHLPRKLILVQITPPNADNGRFIINLGNELPPDILLSGIGRDEQSRSLLPIAAVVWELIDNWLHEVLNYNTVVLSIFQSGGYKERIVDPANCHDDTPAWLRRLPSRLQNVIGAYGGFRLFCVRRLWWGAFRRDGSQALQHDETASVQDRVQNENPLKESERALRAGDEREISRQMRAINAIGARHGVNVVFIVPPVYETDRHDSVVNQIFNRAIALVEDVAVIDHRHMRSEPLHFESAIHPSLHYYHIVAEELRRRGFIE
jgi:hypothetical protein